MHPSDTQPKSPTLRRAQRRLSVCLATLFIAMTSCLPGMAATETAPNAGEIAPIENPGFEAGSLKGWNGWRTRGAKLARTAATGSFAVALGPERAMCTQNVPIKPNSRYRLSARVRTEAGSEEVQLIARDYGGVPASAASALAEYQQISVEFDTAHTAKEVSITLIHPGGPGTGYADDVQLVRLGDAPPPVVQEFMDFPAHKIEEQDGVAQLPAEKLTWFEDAKFGMFIHWGVYASMPEGNEWVMHEKAFTPEYYRQRAEDPATGFTAAKYQPADWAALAKAAGMRYMVLTTRHHDGYALFDSRHENSWTSVKHLGRDLIRDYVAAVREAGLHVGLYYSPLSWRYPGYYDVTGERCLPNVFGYKTAAWHKENARVLKEEVYEQVTRLLSDYGPIEYMFWDGAWLGQTIDKPLENRFWDPGAFQNPANEWQVAEKYVTHDRATGRPLGIMGLVRLHQPQMLVNERFCWVGDVHAEEGAAALAGPVREQTTEKCMSLQKGGWGFRPGRPVYSFDEVSVILSDCAARNINLLLNVSPDREGVIPENQREVLGQIGRWLDKVGPAIHGTRGGPWQPLFGEYGFSFRENRIFAHILPGYRDRADRTFRTHSLGTHRATSVRDLFTGKELAWTRNADHTLTIRDVDYAANPAVTVLEIVLDRNVRAK